MSVVVSSAAGINAFNASTVGGTGTGIKIFPAGGNNFTVGTSSASVPCTVGIPANGQFEQQRFTMKASGKVKLGSTSSPTVLWSLYNGTSLTAASDGTALLTMSAKTGLTVSSTYPWAWIADFQGDSTSGILQAISSTLWVNNATAGTITLTGATGVNFTAGGPVNIVGPGYTTSTGANALNLIIGFTFGVSDASNLCTLSQFCVEM